LRRNRRFLVLGVLLATIAFGIPLSTARNLVIYCSHDADACELAAQTFERETGIITAITRKLIIPANAAAMIRPEALRFAQVTTLDVDPSKYGRPEERRRLLARWQREIGDALR